MKLSTPLFLLSLLQIVAVQSEVIIGLRTVLLGATTTEIAAVNQPLTTVMAEVQPELAVISQTPRNLQGSTDSRNLRGKNRDLTWCSSTCAGYPWGSCWRSIGFASGTCGGWRELKVLSEEEVGQLGEDERHRHLQNTEMCQTAVTTFQSTMEGTASPTVLTIVEGNLQHTCYFFSSP